MAHRILPNDEVLALLESRPELREDFEAQVTKRDGVAPKSIDDYIGRIMAKELANGVIGLALDKDEHGSFINLKPVKGTNPTS